RGRRSPSWWPACWRRAAWSAWCTAWSRRSSSQPPRSQAPSSGSSSGSPCSGSVWRRAWRSHGPGVVERRWVAPSRSGDRADQTSRRRPRDARVGHWAQGGTRTMLTAFLLWGGDGWAAGPHTFWLGPLWGLIGVGLIVGGIWLIVRSGLDAPWAGGPSGAER